MACANTIRCPFAALRHRLRRLRRAPEQGTVMFIVVAGMTTVLAMGSLALDTASWYQKQHATQLAADAAALAAANCLANAGSTGNTCTSTTDTTDAAEVATSIAADNGLTIPTSAVTFSGSDVTVTGSNQSKSIFAEVFGLGTVKPRANSTATWAGSLACQSAGPSCYALFAYDATCNVSHSTSDGAVGVANNGNNSVFTGGVHSNGNIYNSGNLGNATFPSPNVSWGSACPSSDNLNPGTYAVPGSSTLPYPLDFSGLSPASDNNDVAPPNCTYTAGTGAPPSGVSVSGSTMTVSSSAPSGVYCNPSGTIDISGNSASGGYTSPGGTTYIASNFTGINTLNGVTLKAYDNSSNPNPYHLLLYQTSNYWNGTTCSSTDPNQIDIGGNSKDALYGVIFGPCAIIYQTANNTASDMFLEGYNVDLAGNSFTGAGPMATGSGATLTSGSDQLIG
jgi:hypothetical protein